MVKTTLILSFFVFFFLSQITQATPIPVQCLVFNDSNQDGVQQAIEPAIPHATLTNGIDIFEADVSGYATFSVESDHFRFAVLDIPSGYRPTNAWYCPVDTGMALPDTIFFGLTSAPERGSTPFTFAHISDTQITTSLSYPLAEDIAEINSLPDPPLFIVNTGDIVDDGEDPIEWDYYVDQISDSTIPVYHIVGNHDDTPNANPLDLYEDYVGPPYYSFDIANWHFIGYNSWYTEGYTPMQDTWLANDIARVPDGHHIAIFNHFMVRTLSSSRKQAWIDLGVDAVFSGHHHSTNLSMSPSGIGDYNVCYTRGGPRDWTPRLFSLATMHGDGTTTFDLRRLSVDERANLTSPRNGEVVPPGPLVIMAQAYDTVDLAANIQATILDSHDSLVETISLTSTGISGWKGSTNTSGWTEGQYTIQISGGFEGGVGILQSGSFTVAASSLPGIHPDDDWPMFRGAIDGRSFRDDGLDLPLRLAWVSEIPGMVAQNSPIVSDGQVFIGCRTENDINDPGIIAFDAATGATLWRRNLSGGVAYSPLAVDGVLIANALNDSVHGFDCATGETVWSMEAPGSMYVNAAPIGDSSGVLVSSKPYCYMVSPQTGALIWQSDNLGQTWYEFTYSAAAMSQDRVFLNTFGGLGLNGGLDIFNRADGTRIAPQFSGVYRAPAVVGDTLVVGAGADLDRHYLTFRDHTGNILGSGVESLGRGMGGVAIGHGIAVTAGKRGDVVAYSLETGERIWAHSVGDVLLDMSQAVIGGKMTQACPVIADRTVFIGSIDGVLYALDLDTGTELWSMPFGMPIASTAALSGNMLYVGCSDGNLYALKGNSNFVVSSVDEETDFQTNIWFRRAPGHSGSSQVSFEWNLPAASQVDLSIYDLRGSLVATLEKGNFPAGVHRSEWNGRLSGTGTTSSGMYFARLTAGRTVLTEKIVIIK